jgi:hypothetical protein
MNEANLAMEMVSVKLQEASNARKKLPLATSDRKSFRCSLYASCTASR